MNLFFAEELNETEGFLGKAEAHHAIKVLRKQIGDEILVTEGNGIIYNAKIEAGSVSQLKLTMLSVFKQETRKQHLHIAIAPTKANERFEFFIEKATELGIAEITPLLCSNSERKMYKTERGEKIVKSAVKQSLACHLPVFNEMVKFDAFIKQAQTESKLIAHCYDGEKRDFFKSPKMEKTLILIGPEGDFSVEEIKKAQTNGFDSISLGEKRLRTETAALAACFGFLYA